MTLIEMIEQGRILSLLGMAALFAAMIMLLSLLGNGVAKLNKPAGNTASVPASSVPAASSSDKTAEAVTAAICAAVNEYRKNH